MTSSLRRLNLAGAATVIVQERVDGRKPGAEFAASLKGLRWAFLGLLPIRMRVLLSEHIHDGGQGISTCY